MKNKAVKTLVLLLSLGMSASSFTGCGMTQVTKGGVESYEKAPITTQQELTDYYAKQVKYSNESIEKRNIIKHETTYNLHDVDEDTKQQLIDLTAQEEQVLSEDDYPVEDIETQGLISEDNFNYIKSVIDGYTLTKTDKSISNIKGALGYYFVDVTYNIAPAPAGKFKKAAQLMGIRGAYQTMYDSKTNTTYQGINKNYLSVLADALTKYYTDNDIKKKVYYDGYGSFQISDSDIPGGGEGWKSHPDFSELTTDTLESDSEDTDSEEVNPEDEIIVPTDEDYEAETTDDTENADDTENKDTEDTEDTKDTTSDANIANTKLNDAISDSDEQESLSDTDIDSTKFMIPYVRRVDSNIGEIRSNLGMTVDGAYNYIPLDYLYERPSGNGNISGYGILQEGSNGLSMFGFDRNNLSGTLTMRYVFKESSDGSGKIYGYDTYVTDINIDSGIDVSSNDVYMPDYLKTSIESVVDRYDRLQANADLEGMISGGLCEDLGYPVLRDFQQVCSNTTNYTSVFNKCLVRNSAENAYLIQITTYTSEGPKDVDKYGSYKDTYFMVVQQQGTDFKIIDTLRTKREMVREPDIVPDSSTTNRLVALNLAGKVSDDNKEEVQELMTNLYNALINQVNDITQAENGVVDGVDKDGNAIQLTRGIPNLFESDPALLSTEQRNYDIQLLENIVTRFGGSTKVVYKGKITEWISGYKNQVEFVTKELATYEGHESGYYQEVYYLVNKVDGVWYIEERTVIDENANVTNGDPSSSDDDRLDQINNEIDSDEPAVDLSVDKEITSTNIDSSSNTDTESSEDASSETTELSEDASSETTELSEDAISGDTTSEGSIDEAVDENTDQAESDAGQNVEQETADESAADQDK